MSGNSASMKQLQRFYPHLAVIAGFILVALINFYPVLQGQKIYQEDIAQYVGMAKEQNDFRDAGNEEPYWTNSSFGGMPTYQLGAKYPHDYIGALDDALRFLPRPADYLFLYFLGFYVLMLALKADPLKAFLGALAFGFSTYLIIIIGAGHNAKAHAIAYMPMVVAGVILVFRRNYLWGGLLTLVASALEINANHFQMTYYLLFLLGAIAIYFVYELVRSKQYTDLGMAAGTFVVAGLLAMGANASNLMATAEFADFSIRGKSELTFTPEGGKKGEAAMDYDYITEYSYGITESFDLIAPRLFGGSNGEKLGTDSHMYEFMVTQGVPENQAAEAVQRMPLYWGDQPIVSGPAYIGAVVFFLSLIGLFSDRRKIKYAFLGGAILSLLLSWGKNFSFLTEFFIDYVPLYDKFRAVSSIQVILELCFPVLAIMGLETFSRLQPADRVKALYKPAMVFFGIVLVLIVFKGSFDFSGNSDGMLLQNYGPDFVDALKADRKSFYSSDLLRSSFLVLIVAGVLWFWSKEKFAARTAVIIIGLVMVADLFFIGKNYVDAKDFVSSVEVDRPFERTQADEVILQDTSHYRVFEIGRIHNARTSYFHKSISGYSAVRPRRMEELLEYQIAKNNLEIINFLNVKYVIQTDEKGQEFVIPNPDANGNAWFVPSIKAVSSPDAEMRALDKLPSKKVAILNTTQFPGIQKREFSLDTLTAGISLVKYQPNLAVYKSRNASEGFAVFSEMYYPKGWKATIDGKEASIVRTDYALRGLEVPAGNHTIEFRFEPEVVKTGGNIALTSNLLIVLLIGGGIWYENKGKKKAA